MSKLGPRKTLYWPEEWGAVWQKARIRAIQKNTTVSKLVYDLLKKEIGSDQPLAPKRKEG